VGMTTSLLPAVAPKHLLGIGEPDDIVEGIARGIDLFDCAVPTRLARHGMALANLPESRHRFDVARATFERDRRPLVEGCPCPACRDHTRAYLHYLARERELTGVRLLTIHNLTYLERLVGGARDAIAAGIFAAYREAILAGATPWDAARSGRSAAG
jgi:queuine tRNA-ribosyltransferase